MPKQILPEYKNWFDNLSPQDQEFVKSSREYGNLFSDDTPGPSGTVTNPDQSKQQQPKQINPGEKTPPKSDTTTSQGSSVLDTPPETPAKVNRKRPAVNTKTKSKVTKPNNNQGTQVLDTDMPLVGTAMGQGGTGDGNAETEESVEMYKSPSSNSNFGYKESVYRKVHRFLTFGIAHTWISKNLTSPTENQRILTTPLAEIPWQYPFLYLNQSEFDLLPGGSFVKEISIKIIHRGNRIAFETASSNTALATLNQIQNIMIAKGLNKTGWGADSSFSTFNSSQPMIPTNALAPTYSLYPSDFYGNPNATIANTIPNHQVGFKTPLYNYFCIFTTAEQFGGTPPIVENIEFYDGKTSINQEVCHMTYRPKMGGLKVPLRHIRTGIPTGINGLNIHINGNRTDTITANYVSIAANASGNENSFTNTVVQPSTNIAAGNFGIIDPIEKIQFYRKGPWGQNHHPEIQPSIHCGIQAIPSLTTTGLFNPIASFTDAQADWEVECEMIVIEQQPTKLPFASRANVPAGEAWYRTVDNSDLPDVNTCTFAGLYSTNSIRG